MKRFLFVLICLSLVFSLAFAQTKAPKYKFVLVPHLASHPFWVPAINGMKDAMAVFGVECQWIGPGDYNIQGQVDTIENALSSGIDGIAFSRPDPAAFNKVSQKATEKGIPVVVFNTDSPDALPKLPFVGGDGVFAGQVLAEQMIKYLPGGGKVVVVTPLPGHADLEKRISGFMSVMKNNPKYKIIGPVDISAEESKQIAAEDAVLLANPDLKGIVTVGADTDVLARWMKKNKLKNKIVAGGYDLLPGTIQGVKDGDIKYTIGQSPYLQGFMPVAMMYWHLTRQVPLISVNTGADVIDSINIEGFDPKFR